MRDLFPFGCFMDPDFAINTCATLLVNAWGCGDDVTNFGCTAQSESCTCRGGSLDKLPCQNGDICPPKEIVAYLSSTAHAMVIELWEAP